jgi:hypothetical protein
VIAVWAALLAVAVVPPAQAQRGFGGLGVTPGSRGFGGGQRGTGGGFHARGPSRGGGGRGHYARPRFGGRNYNRSAFIVAPYFYPTDFYSDYYSSQPTVTEAPPPQVVVVRTTEPEVQAPPPPPVESLMLELRGDHWVRITDSGESEVGDAAAQHSSAQVSSRRSAATETAMPVRPVPPAVLVFRDGHQEQTKKYTIIGPVIYTSADYWAGGGWTRKIPIAELDVPATLRLNQEHGVKFNLPSAPNEVVVRP